MDTTQHERFQQEIAAFLAGRLTDEETTEIRNHVRSCEECAGVVEAWAPAAVGFRQAGDELLSPHPESRELLKYGRGETTAGEALGRHLETCSTCLLEVEGARVGSIVREIRPSRKLTRYVSMALAAGLVLGLGLATLLPGPGEQRAQGSGATHLYTLEAVVRSSNAPTVLTVDQGSTVLPLVLIPAIPDGASPEAVFMIDIRDEQGEAVWSNSYTAAELNRYLELSGVLTLLVPVLPDGSYSLLLVSEADPIQEFRFEVRQR